MRFDKIIPQPRLQPYISQLVIAENQQESVYKVFPSTALVLGLQYEGKLKTGKTGVETNLTSAGISGIADQLKWFANSANTKSILIYFTELGLAHFSACPAHELFNRHVPLEDLFDKQKVQDVKQRLAEATTDQQRIGIVEQFLLAHLKDIQPDQLILAAIQLIHQSRGAIQISELNRRLMISQSPLEKRFRKLVGTTPKKFASIVRFNAILKQLSGPQSLLDICFEHTYFDQAHFSKNFKVYTGESPDTFRGLLE
jgi:AraC-like DNA-binding protein